MDSIILNGTKIAAGMLDELGYEFNNLRETGKIPKIATVYFGDDPSALSYIKSKEKTFRKAGVDLEKINFPSDTGFGEVSEKISGLNTNADVSGIMIEMPVPGTFNKLELFSLIEPSKDVDCLTPVNNSRLFHNEDSVVPATAGAVIEILKRSRIEIFGKDVTIIGRSNIVGKPLILLFLKENATVTVCHTKTADLEKHSRNADILVCSAGKAKIINSKFINQNSTVIDVGINFLDGKLCGDVDFDDVNGKVHAITPVPGGVGPVTTVYILKNLLNLMK